MQSNGRIWPRAISLAAAGLTIGVGAKVSLAHEEGAPFSSAIPEPIVNHHAHIENEQKLNSVLLRGAPLEDGTKRNGFQQSIELAYADKKFRKGFEIFIPFIRQPQAGGGSTLGLGDIEIQPFKYAFINKPDFIVSTAQGFILPTGSERRGLGGGRTAYEPHFFLDKAFGNFFVGANLIPSFTLRGPKETELEYGATLAYSFIKGTRANGGFAPPVPKQRRVVTVLLEVAGGQTLRGGEDSKPSTVLVPGIQLWDVKSGYQLRFGVGIPLTRGREADRTFYLQFSNHFNWSKGFGRRDDHHR